VRRLFNGSRKRNARAGGRWPFRLLLHRPCAAEKEPPISWAVPDNTTNPRDGYDRGADRWLGFWCHLLDRVAMEGMVVMSWEILKGVERRWLSIQGVGGGNG
jgi:hypothetical protein